MLEDMPTMEPPAAQAESPSAEAADSAWDEMEQRQFLLAVLMFREDFDTISQLMLPRRTVRGHHAGCKLALAAVSLARLGPAGQSTGRGIGLN
jgi:hypothetical protein